MNGVLGHIYLHIGQMSQENLLKMVKFPIRSYVQLLCPKPLLYTIVKNIALLFSDISVAIDLRVLCFVKLAVFSCTRIIIMFGPFGPNMLSFVWISTLLLFYVPEF